MAYDRKLAERVDEILGGKKGFTNRKMFGGVGYMLHGNMSVGVWKDWLIVRIGENNFDALLKRKHTKVFDIPGHAMRGWMMVHKDGARTSTQLKGWIDQSLKFVRTLPKKS